MDHLETTHYHSRDLGHMSPPLLSLFLARLAGSNDVSDQTVALEVFSKPDLEIFQAIVAKYCL
jgi:hypothetical protein